MGVRAPDRPTRSSELVDRDELEALVEALIEEARRRARRRRRRYGACILLVTLAAGSVYFGFDRGGGATGPRSTETEPSRGATSEAHFAGGRWQPSHGPYGGPAYTVAVAPSAPDNVYLGTARGVFRSRDAGQSWSGAGLAFRSGRLTSIEPQITSLAVDPRAPEIVYAARTASSDGGLTRSQQLFKSRNGGRTWHALGLPAVLVAVSPGRRATVFAITSSNWRRNRLFRSTNGGRSWEPADRGLASARFSALAFDPTSTATVYAATEDGILKSTNGGSSWREASDRTAHQGVSTIAVDPTDPDTVYAGTSSGVIKSLDGGRNWRVVNAVMGGHGRDRGYGEVGSLVVDPLDPQTIFATVGCTGIFKSIDGGRTWHSANAGRDPQCRDSALALDPRASQTLYAVYFGRGVFKSTDGALSWRPVVAGLNLTTVSSLALDPHDPRIVYASAGSNGLFKSMDGGVHWLPDGSGLRSVGAVATDPRDPTIVLASVATHRVVRSTDSGGTWQPTRAVMRSKAVVLAISGRQAYAGTFSQGVFSSTDGGHSWRGLLAPAKTSVQALAIAPDDPAVAYAGTVGFGPHAGGLFGTIDGGRSWKRLTDGVAVTDVFAVALDPVHPTTAYIGTGGDGVFKSTDGGASWERASSGLPRIRVKAITRARQVIWVTMTVEVAALAIDPASPTTLYAATEGSGIFRSTDAGESWHPFNAGLNVHDVRSLAIDATGRALYAGTVSGGVAALRIGTR